jgi:hypothetical protein
MGFVISCKLHDMIMLSKLKNLEWRIFKDVSSSIFLISGRTLLERLSVEAGNFITSMSVKCLSHVTCTPPAVRRPPED